MQKYMSILLIAAPHMEEFIIEAATKNICSGYENTILQNFMKCFIMAASKIMVASG